MKRPSTGRCLVLGASGFIGRNLCLGLKARGCFVRAYSRRPLDDSDFVRQASNEWIIGDYRNPEVLRSIVADIDVIFHLISATTPASSHRDPFADARDNILGSIEILEAARLGGRPRVVFVSSGGAVYGIPQNTPIPESAPTEPISAYGISKLAIEKYLHFFRVQHKLDSCVLRVANPFGEYLPTSGSQGVVGIFIHKALRRETIEIWGTDQTVRDFIPIDDVVEALIRAKDHTGPDRVFNIGSGIGRSLGQVIDDIETAIGLPVARRVIRGTPPDVPINVLDVSLAERRLGWKPEADYHGCLERTVAWVRERLPAASDRIAG